MKNIIIKDFDKFKEISESDMTLLSFLGGQVGAQIGRTIKQQVVTKIFEYMGIPSEDPNDPNSGTAWIKGVITRTLASVSPQEMDDILTGRIPLNSSKFWVDRIAKALKEQIVLSNTPSAGGLIRFLGVAPDKFIGRLISNTFVEFILDEERLKQSLLAVWAVVVEDEYIPQKDAGEVYQKAVSELTPEQQKRLEGSTWQSSQMQKDFLKRKGG
jgi:hypothetical protein